MEKVTGVRWYEKINKWRASITVNKKWIHLGDFDNHYEAAQARKDAEKEYGIERVRNTTDLTGKKFGKLTVIGDTGKRDKGGGKVLLCRHEDGTITETPKNNLISGLVNGSKTVPIGKTGERRISFDKSTNKYMVSIRFKGKEKNIGRFKTLEEAITRRDEVLQRIQEEGNWSFLENEKPIGRKGKKNITFDKRTNKYLVRKTINGNVQRFGRFETLEQAIAKRDEILQLIEQGKL